MEQQIVLIGKFCKIEVQGKDSHYIKFCKIEVQGKDSHYITLE